MAFSGSISLCFIILVTGCNCYGTDDHNVVQNPSFEESYEPWIRQKRSSMWDVRKLTDSDELVVSGEAAHSGKHSLALRLLAGGNFKAVFASQYIALQESSLVYQHQIPLYFSFRYKGGGASSLMAKLDIRYDDGRYLFIDTSPVDEEAADAFHLHCVTIPSYGRVRAVQVHFALDKEQMDFIYVDDVVVGAHSTQGKDKCKLYTDNFPVERQVQVNYIKPNTQSSEHRITLATQLTADRFDKLIETARHWKGPISATILLFHHSTSAKSQLSDIVTKYYNSHELQETASLHIVFEDISNVNDKMNYPVNFLRNIAISNVDTSHVFFVDADICPGFSETDADAWVSDAKTLFSDACSGTGCAFVVPTFHSKTSEVDIPQDKSKLLEKLADKEASLEIYHGVSHSVVRYGQWQKTDTPYKIDYMKDMEPYFIVSSNAPLMNEIYAGYGRDKCAYSTDLHHSGYSFVVLDQAFLVNRKDIRGSPTIYGRSKGLQLRVFLNIAFHEHDIKEGFKLIPSDRKVAKTLNYYKQSPLVSPSSRPNSTQMYCDSSEERCHENVNDDRETKKVKQHREIACSSEMSDADTNVLVDAENPNFPSRVRGRKDIFVETLMKLYGTYTYIDLPHGVRSSVSLMIPLMHPDAVISIVPNFGTELKIDHGSRNGIHMYRGPESVRFFLNMIRKEFPGPSTIMVSLTNTTSANDTLDYIQAALAYATDTDVIVVDIGRLNLTSIRSALCAKKEEWTIQHINDYFLIKAKSLESPAALAIPPLPMFVKQSSPMDCSNFPTTDIILMTRNRPLQTFAFLESLVNLVTGVNKVWVIQRADDDLFMQGYEYVYSCFKDKISIEVMVETNDTDIKYKFGTMLKRTFQRSEAKYLVFAVDEIIWHRPVDLKYAACLLEAGDGDIASFQLRLGENIGHYAKIKERENTFHELQFDSNVKIFYPRRLPYDFGYITNVDGTMMAKEHLLEDLGDFTLNHPGSLENSWLRQNLFVRSQQWHLMYKYSTFLNNMALKDGRVAASSGPSDEGARLTKQLLNDHLVIDVNTFGEKNKDHKSTHNHFEVSFIKDTCSV